MADPTFAYEQQMARVFGLEAIHMADTDVLPYDYVTYARQIQTYLFAAQARAREAGLGGIDFNAAIAAGNRFTTAAAGGIFQAALGRWGLHRAQCFPARSGRRFSFAAGASGTALVSSHHLRPGRVYGVFRGCDPGSE